MWLLGRRIRSCVCIERLIRTTCRRVIVVRPKIDEDKPVASSIRAHEPCLEKLASVIVQTSASLRTLVWGLETVGELHKTLSPCHANEPRVSGVVCQDTASFTSLEFAGGATAAYNHPPGTACCNCPLLIWNRAASTGSPRTAADALPITSERRYWWKLGSSYKQNVTFRSSRREKKMCTSARIKESPGTSVGVVPAGALEVLDGPPPGTELTLLTLEVDWLGGVEDAVPCRH